MPLFLIPLLLFGVLHNAGTSWLPHSSPSSTLTSVLWDGHRGFWVEQGNSPSKHKVATLPSPLLLILLLLPILLLLLLLLLILLLLFQGRPGLLLK